MAIKKNFVEIVELLEANKNKKVSSIMDDILALASSKKKTNTYLKDENGKTIAIFCYYHKQWELLEKVPFGSKANSATGFNTMCKVGTSKWTKAQRDAKNANTKLLVDVANGDVEPSKVVDMMADIETSRLVVDTTDMPEGVTVDYLNEEFKVNLQ